MCFKLLWHHLVALGVGLKAGAFPPPVCLVSLTHLHARHVVARQGGGAMGARRRRRGGVSAVVEQKLVQLELAAAALGHGGEDGRRVRAYTRLGARARVAGVSSPQLSEWSGGAKAQQKRNAASVGLGRAPSHVRSALLSARRGGLGAHQGIRHRRGV
jgi:hypothetical protein